MKKVPALTAKKYIKNLYSFFGESISESRIDQYLSVKAIGEQGIHNGAPFFSANSEGRLPLLWPVKDQPSANIEELVRL